MAIEEMVTQICGKDGFIAALEQSGGSTPGALRLYGIPDSTYGGDAEMFERMHEMRVRIMTAPAFTGAKVIAAILFEGTMDGRARDKPLGSGIETLVRAEGSTTLKDMCPIKSMAAVAVIVLLAACSQQAAFTDPTARATALPGRFAPYVGPGNGWGGPTVSLYTPSAGGRG